MFDMNLIGSRIAEARHNADLTQSKLASFIDRDVLEQIADEQYQKRGIRALEVLAPFLGPEFLKKFTDK